MSDYRQRNHKKKSLFKAKPSKQKQEGKEIKELNEKKIKIGDLDPSEIKSFSSLPLSSNTQQGLKNNGFTEPTKIQRESLIHSLQGLDVVASAKTGSGKTLAFIIPLLETLYCNRWSPIDGLGAVIITPTRELAYQIYEVLKKVGEKHYFSAGLVIGGKDLKFEWNRISECNIMICTPGRLLQHMTENPKFNCDNIKLLILDEADQCLSMGFAGAMNNILQELPSDRQTLLFSATQTSDVEELIRAGCKNPVSCLVHEHSKTVTPKMLFESYVVCEEQDKITFLWSFIRHHRQQKILVFVSTRKQVSFIHNLFLHLRPNQTVMQLHGRMHQLRRMKIYDEFCEKKRAILFATDVASRGLDIPSVDWVIQMDCPEDVKTYIHRAGRTARHANSGESILLLTPIQEAPMVAELQLKSSSIEKIEVDSRKLHNIQPKIDLFVSKNIKLQQDAQRSFKSYLKCIALMKNRKVFDITSINLEAFAQSLGLENIPHIRFVEKLLKNVALKKEKTGSAKTNLISIPNVTTDDKIDDEDDFISIFKKLNCKIKDPSEYTLPEIDISDYPLFQETGNPKSKFSDINQFEKDNSINNRVVFSDDEGDSTTVGSTDQQEPQSISAADEDFYIKIDIPKMKEMMKHADKIDQKNYKLVFKEKNRKEKQKLQAEKGAAREEKLRCKVQDDDDSLGSDEDEESDVEDAFTQELIDDLPDPDKIYGKDQNLNSESNEDDNVDVVDDENDDDEDDSDEDVENDSDDKLRENEAVIKQKRVFSGKRKAKEKVREAKRARLADENDLATISFDEKENLALFLLKHGR